MTTLQKQLDKMKSAVNIERFHYVFDVWSKFTVKETSALVLMLYFSFCKFSSWIQNQKCMLQSPTGTQGFDIAQLSIVNIVTEYRRMARKFYCLGIVFVPIAQFLLSFLPCHRMFEISFAFQCTAYSS